MSLNAQITLSLVAHESSSADISRTLRATPAVFSLALTDGTGANQAQIAWSGTRTLGAGGYDDLDLSALADDRGTVAFTKVKALYVRNSHASLGLKLGASSGGAAPSNPWAGTPTASGGYTVSAGQAVFTAAGSTSGVASVSSGSKVLRVGGSTGATYEIVLVGEGTIT